MILLRRLGHAVIAGVVPGAKHRLLNLIFVHQGDQLLRRASHAGPAAKITDMGVGVDLFHEGFSFHIRCRRLSTLEDWRTMMTTAPMTMPATVCVVMVLPHLARRKKAPAQCLRPQRRGVRTVTCRNDTRSEGGDCRRKGAAEPQQKGRLTKESRPPEQTIPEAGFFLSVGSAVVKNNPRFLIASNSYEK